MLFRSSITPVLTVKHPTAADNYASTVTDVSAVNLQACANGVWTKVSYTYVDAGGALLGLEVAFDFGNNFSTTGKSIQITEVGVSATQGVPFTGLNSFPPPVELRPYNVELLFCQRYFTTSFLPGTTPAQNVGTVTGEAVWPILTTTGFQTSSYIPWPVLMFAIPTVVTFNPAAANAEARDENASADGSSTGVVSRTVRGARFRSTASASSVANNIFGLHYTASAEI